MSKFNEKIAFYKKYLYKYIKLIDDDIYDPEFLNMYKCNK